MIHPRAALPAAPPQSDGVERQFGVVVDAGSSGSRIQVYGWRSVGAWRREVVQKALQSGADADGILDKIASGESAAAGLPLIGPSVSDPEKTPWHAHAEPGLSTFADNIDGIAAYLAPLLQFAQSRVPGAQHSTTPLFVLGTAGLRLLPEADRARVLTRVCDLVRDTTRFEMPPDCAGRVEVISGEWEGVYGWLALNFLAGKLPVVGRPRPAAPARPDDPATLGFADMGGASTQLCFEPVRELALEHADDLTRVTLTAVDGASLQLDVWVRTWLGHGVNEARKEHVAALLASAAPLNGTESPGLIDDPCLPPDLSLSAAGSSSVSLRGTGNVTACLDTLRLMLNQSAPCPDAPCLWNGVHAPLRPKDLRRLRFVGVSEYWYANDDIHDLDGLYEHDAWLAKVQAFCATPWAQTLEDWRRHRFPGLSPDNKDDLARLQLGCFRSAWVGNVIWAGLGVPHDDASVQKPGDDAPDQLFRGVQTLNGMAISWTLGAMLVSAKEAVDTAPPWRLVIEQEQARLQASAPFSHHLAAVALVAAFAVAIVLWAVKGRLGPLAKLRAAGLRGSMQMLRVYLARARRQYRRGGFASLATTDSAFWAAASPVIGATASP